MARIDGLGPKRAGLLTRLGYWFARKRLGAVPEPLTLYAHSPWMMRAYGSFEMAAERATHVDVRLKTLASLKAAALVGCAW